MRGLVSLLKSTLCRNEAEGRPQPSPPASERSRLVDRDNGIAPNAGMFGVAWLNSVQVLISFLDELPYNHNIPLRRRIYLGKNIYHFVRPIPQAHLLDMKPGRKFTLFLGSAHFLVELIAILSENHLPFREESGNDDAAMHVEPFVPSDSGWPHTPPNTPPPNSHRRKNSPTNPTQDAGPDHVQQEIADVIETSDHHSKQRSGRDYNRDLPLSPEEESSPERQDEPVVNSSPANSSSKSHRKRNDKQAEHYLPNSTRPGSLYFPDPGPSNGYTKKSENAGFFFPDLVQSSAVVADSDPERMPTTKQPRGRSMSREPPQKRGKGPLQVMNPGSSMISTARTTTRVGGLANSGESVLSYYRNKPSNPGSSKHSRRHSNHD